VEPERGWASCSELVKKTDEDCFRRNMCKNSHQEEEGRRKKRRGRKTTSSRYSFEVDVLWLVCGGRQVLALLHAQQAGACEPRLGDRILAMLGEASTMTILFLFFATKSASNRPTNCVSHTP
jgi:hypothetical protein